MPRLGRAHARRLRVFGQAVSEVHASEDVRRAGEPARCRICRHSVTRTRSGTALGLRSAKPNQADLDEFRRGIEPLATAGKLGALLAQFPAELQGDAGLARLPRAAPGRAHRLPRRRRTAAQELERSDRRDAGAAQRISGRMGADRRAEVQALDQAELPAECATASTTCGFTDGTSNSGGGTRTSEDRYDYLYSADELREFSDTADAARRLVKKLYLYTNNHFSAKSVANAAMIKQQLGEPDRRRVSAGVSRALSAACRRGQTPIINQQSTIINSRYSLTYIRVITSPRCIVAGTSAPAMTWPKTV